MSSPKQVFIPRRIDDPLTILIWDIEQVTPIIIGLVAGMFLRQVLLCVAAGWIVSKIYTGFRTQTPDGYIMHLGYWYGALPTKCPSFPNPFVRRFFP